MEASSPSDYAWVHQARTLSDELVELAKRHVGQVVAVTIAAPDSVPHEALRRFVTQALHHTGMASSDVTVLVLGSPGPLRIISLEVER